MFSADLWGLIKGVPTHSLRATIMRHFLILASLAFVTASYAEEGDFDFNGLIAKKALRDYKKAVAKDEKATELKRKELDEEAANAAKTTRDAFAENLKKALKQSMQAGNLEEANKIDSAIKALKKGGDPTGSPEKIGVGSRQKRSSSLYLSDISPILASTYSFGSHGFVGEGAFTKIRVGGKPFLHGLGTHPLSNSGASVTYDIGGKFSEFTGGVAIDDRKRAATPLTFEIIGDGRQIWISRPVQRGGMPQAFKVSVKRIKRLTLIVRCPGHNGTAWAVWLDPKLKK